MMATSKIFKVSALVAIMFFAVDTAHAQTRRTTSDSDIDWGDLLHNLDSVRRVVGKMPDDTAKLAQYHFISKYSYNVDSAGKYCNLLLDLATKLDNQRYIAYGYSSLARYYSWTGDYDRARDADMEAIYIWEKLEDKYHLARVNMQFASILKAQGMYDQASKYYHLSADAFRELGDSTYISQVLQNLGDVNISVGFYNNATTYYEQALAIDSSINNVYGLISDHTGIARVNVNKYKRRRRDALAEEMLQSAKYHLDTAYVLALPLPNIIELQQIHIYKAMVYMEIAEKSSGKALQAALDSCERHCNLLLKLRRDYNLKSNLSGVVTLQGRAH